MELHPTPANSEARTQAVQFGARLKAARLDSGNSIESLALATRISRSFIEALENGDLHRLPGQVFGRGFVRSIAKTLGISGEEYCAAFDAAWELCRAASAPSTPSAVASQPRHAPPPWRRRAGRLLSGVASDRRIWGVAAALLLAVGAYRLASVFELGQRSRAWFASSEPEAKTTKPEPPVSQEAVTNSVTASVTAPADPHKAEPAKAPPASEPGAQTDQNQDGAATSSQAASAPLAESISVTASPSSSGQGPKQRLTASLAVPVRLRLEIDGQPAQTREFAAGDHTFEFSKKLDLMVYDAGAVQLSFNGSPLGSLGNKGRVRRLSFQAEKPAATKTF